jgi:hypothetical protein
MKKLEKQETQQWTKTRSLYCLINTWCKQNMRWIKSTKATICVGKIEGGAFLTSYYTIQWNTLEDQKHFGKFHQLNLLYIYIKQHSKKLCSHYILEAFINHDF